jgi:ABC-2 type transport system ATP-binding protein
MPLNLAAEAVHVSTVIHTRGLSKRFGRRAVLRDVDLDVPAGQVFGYLGPNGAGKSTTIRILIGALRPTAGRATIGGHDSIRDREAAQRMIGYLPGEFSAYPDLSATEYLRYLCNLRGGTAWPYAEKLSARFDLDLTTHIGALSHGSRQKVGIVQAFMHEPPVLVLDEPTIGLDPLAQREFLDLVRETTLAGATVFLSSHVMSEVEAVAETVAILRQGSLVVVDSVEALKSRAVRRIDLALEESPPIERLQALPGVRDVDSQDHAVSLAVEGPTTELIRVVAPYGVERIVTHEVDLEEVFLSYYEGRE